MAIQFEIVVQERKLIPSCSLAFALTITTITCAEILAFKAFSNSSSNWLKNVTFSEVLQSIKILYLTVIMIRYVVIIFEFGTLLN